MLPERRRALGAAALGILLAACTATSGPPRAPRVSLPLSGTLLLGTGQNLSGVAAYDAATRRLTPIRAPGSAGFDFISGAFWTGPGTGVFMAQPSHQPGRLFLVKDSVATPVGPPYLAGDLLGVSGGRAVASTCLPSRRAGNPNRVSVLDLAHPDAWRTVGRGCGKALAPDGSGVAVTATGLPQTNLFGTSFSLGKRVWSVPLDGGPRKLLLDVTALPELGAAMVADPQVTGVAWGKPGLAVSVSNGETAPWALVLVPPTGPPTVVPLGEEEPFGLAWQPEGDLLAFSDCYQCTTFGRNPAHTADIRLYDARTGALRQIAAANNFLTGLVWSPTGEVVTTLTSDSELLFVDATGRAEVRRSVDAVPEDWSG